MKFCIAKEQLFFLIYLMFDGMERFEIDFIPPIFKSDYHLYDFDFFFEKLSHYFNRTFSKLEYVTFNVLFLK